jgi:hypothetical protein
VLLESLYERGAPTRGERRVVIGEQEEVVIGAGGTSVTRIMHSQPRFGNVSNRARGMERSACEVRFQTTVACVIDHDDFKIRNTDLIAKTVDCP